MIGESDKTDQLYKYFEKDVPEQMGCLALLFDISGIKQEEHDKKLEEYTHQLVHWFGYDYQKKQNESIYQYHERITFNKMAERFKNIPEPSTEQVDTWLAEALGKAADRALDKLGLVREELIRDPMVIHGPLFWEEYGISKYDICSVKGNDGSLRFSCHQLVVICLSESRIVAYSANFNSLKYSFLSEKTVEYLYRDIVSVSTEEKSTNYNLPNGKTLSRAQIFRLAVPSGDSIEVVINSPEIKDLLGSEPKLTNHDQSIQAIREMLKTKKG